MAVKVCRKCEKILNDGDLIKATVVARFKSVPSRIAYAISHPTDCIWVEHFQCSSPQLGIEIINPEVEFE